MREILQHELSKRSEINNKIIYHTKRGELDKVEELFKLPQADIAFTDEQNKTALYHAWSRLHTEFIDSFESKHASIDSCISDRVRNMITAAERSEDRCLRLRYANLQDISEIAMVLKHNKNIVSIDFAYSNIGDKVTKQLAYALRFNTHINSINLSTCNIAMSGGIALAQMLKQNQSIKKLDISGNVIGFDGLYIFGEAIRENNTLAILDIGHNSIHNHPKNQKFIEALKINQSLKQVKVGFYDHKEITPDQINAILAEKVIIDVKSEAVDKLGPICDSEKKENSAVKSNIPYRSDIIPIPSSPSDESKFVELAYSYRDHEESFLQKFVREKDAATLSRNNPQNQSLKQVEFGFGDSKEITPVQANTILAAKVTIDVKSEASEKLIPICDPKEKENISSNISYRSNFIPIPSSSIDESEALELAYSYTEESFLQKLIREEDTTPNSIA
ncbi:MAG: hypothetical protein HOM96_04295, partial [Rickettsiales bacterium]|nr:hypothetical protein [Rickettsiales bacterium]